MIRRPASLLAFLLVPASLLADAAPLRERTDLLPATVPTFAVAFLAAVSLAAAILVHRLSGRMAATPSAPEGVPGATPDPLAPSWRNPLERMRTVLCHLLSVAAA